MVTQWNNQPFFSSVYPFTRWYIYIFCWPGIYIPILAIYTLSTNVWIEVKMKRQNNAIILLSTTYSSVSKTCHSQDPVFMWVAVNICRSFFMCLHNCPCGLEMFSMQGWSCPWLKMSFEQMNLCCCSPLLAWGKSLMGSEISLFSNSLKLGKSGAKMTWDRTWRNCFLSVSL